MNIELRHLRYFVAVAEEALLSAPPRAFNIPAAAAQSADTNLEQQVGARLLARTNRSVALTAAGRQFLVDSRHPESGNDAAARAERLHQGFVPGEIRYWLYVFSAFYSGGIAYLSLFRQSLSGSAYANA